MRALVMGARGAVGRVVVEELRSRGHVVTRAGRGAGKDLIGLDLTRLDLTAPEGLRTLAHLSAVHDVVINASGVETPALARCGAPAVVEISATSAYLAALRRAVREAVGGTTMSEAPVGTVVTGAGLVPGLSTLLIAELDTEPGDDVDLGVVLGTGEHHGAAAVEWTAGLLGTRVHHPPEGRRVVNLRQSRRITGAQRSAPALPAGRFPRPCPARGPGSPSA
ncbi:NAD-dependent epimerase/dehydratase family protein [Gordonia polyisoprenivorans]|uniref:NAD-dependent epimerase/dehydratase family protein n=1 Tax=Gordonia polyisoprenivorans TaxID=84595 RepID=UPI0022FFF7FE|nr:NAD-dependent epimerase/dehydratase family protein [Gordonia polyisoprenivorans]WCB35726.1 NAD-dependent epimerase/dehydratase family protein [Gordonia polyisoprenivorans]